jgi:nucleoside phosphorylase
MQLLDVNALRGTIDFGIIAVKVEEYAAIAEKCRLKDKAIGRRRYGIGWIQTTKNRGYAVACVRCVDQGQAAAQDVAEDMIDDLAPRWILVVGICGGLPSTEFSLGDVIVASRVHDFSVNATTYKEKPTFDTRGRDVPGRARDVVAQLPDIFRTLRGWNRQRSLGVPIPRVKVPVDLADERLYGPAPWKTKVLDSLKWRFKDAPRSGPVAYTGPIASSNTLVKNPDLVTRLLPTMRAIVAFEMEMAGVMRAASRHNSDYPVLGLRGVSDIIGFRRHQSWTAYACHSVAAFTVGLIRSGELLEAHPKVPGPRKNEAGVTEKSDVTVNVAGDNTDLINKLVSEQKRQIENLPLLRQSQARESFAFLFPDVFIDPRVVLRKQPSNKNWRFTEWMRTTFRPGVSASIIGPSGVGKSTALIRTYLEAATAFLQGSSRTVPIFCELRAMRGAGQLDRCRIIDKVAAALGIELRASALTRGTEILFFLDGLDEFAAIASEEERAATSSWPVFHEWHLLGARSEIYLQLLMGSEIEHLYTEVIELQQWDFQQEVGPFIEAYFRKTTDDWHREASRFKKFLQDNRLTDLVTTPLAVTMLIAIWRYEDKPDELLIRTRSELYGRFFKNLVLFEVQREGSEIRDQMLLMSALKEAAWQLYHMQRDYSRDEPAVHLHELSEIVGTAIGVPSEALQHSRSFLSVLDVRQDGSSLGTSDVRAFRHESLQAFLVAEVLFDAVVSGRPSLEAALKTVFTYEVNTFVRERLEKETDRRPLIEQRLLEVYRANLTAGNQADAIQVRNGAAYFLGRLGSGELKRIYDDVREGRSPEHPMVKGTMASGLILMNDEQCELDYLDNLHEGHPDDVRTRTFHLVYYGDLPNRGPDSLLTDKKKSGLDDWKRTRTALVSRLQSDRERDLRLRAFDLRVFRRFCETRGYRDFTSEERAAIVTAQMGIDLLPTYKQAVINEEVDKLLRLMGRSF